MKRGDREDKKDAAVGTNPICQPNRYRSGRTILYILGIPPFEKVLRTPDLVSTQGSRVASAGRILVASEGSLLARSRREGRSGGEVDAIALLAERYQLHDVFVPKHDAYQHVKGAQYCAPSDHIALPICSRLAKPFKDRGLAI